MSEALHLGSGEMVERIKRLRLLEGNVLRRGPEGDRHCPAFRMGTSGEYESMKSRETLIRLKKFQVDEKRRRVTQIEGMIADFQRMSVELEREIQTEQERAGINDPPTSPIRPPPRPRSSAART